jgi:hypothetical protein
MRTELKVFAEKTKNLFPEDLAFTLQNGEWFINKEEPFIIPTPLEDFQGLQDFEFPDDEIPQNLIIFNREGTISDMEKQDALLLINKTNFIIRTKDGTNSVPLKDTIPFKRLDNYQITKTEFSRIIDFATYLPWIMPVIAFLSGIFGLMLGGAIEVVMVAAFLLVISLIMKVVINFADVIKISFHTSTVIFTIQLLLSVFNLFLAYPIIFWLAHISYGVIVLSVISKDIQGKG